MNKEMRQKIEYALAEQARLHGIRILYACESGSRAWGFASPDSDYDVRFVYVHPQDWYLSVFPGRDVIEQPINDLLDVSGWDLRKALALLYQSNGALIEWLHSPIVYTVQKEVITTLRELAARSFRPKSACHHYLGMANKGWDAVSGKAQVKLKRYFYTLRALLCGEWIATERTIPPVKLQEILARFYPQGEVRLAIDELLKIKAESHESDLVNRADYSNILNIVDGRIKQLFESIPNNMPENTGKSDMFVFDEVLRGIIRDTNLI
jgi:predicted nucleotidyltransferase